MAAGGLSDDGLPAVQPWLAPFLPWLAQTDPRPAGRLDLARLNALARDRGLVLADGRPLRFVAAGDAEALPYEWLIAERGEVPTRCAGPGMLHDWFNALCWLRWPQLKASMNRLQAGAIADNDGDTGRRGPLRDAVTLFDESGALFLTRDADAVTRLLRRDWPALFLARRGDFDADIQVFLVGHALLEKLCQPYKAICAHALPLTAAPASSGAGGMVLLDGPGHDASAGFDTLDARAAALLDAGGHFRRALAPLPLLGIPGWWPANEDPAFYNDPLVFRRQDDNRRRAEP